jgi:hypothetical protein
MGRPVRLVDGTTVTLPDTAANQAAYPQSRGQKAGLGFPICRLVGIICLASGAVLDASLGRFRGKGGDEQTLLAAPTALLADVIQRVMTVLRRQHLQFVIRMHIGFIARADFARD